MQSSHQVSRAVAIALAAATVFNVAPAAAQDAADELKLEEVTVTARKRAESVQDVPISITAFSAEAIEKAGIYDIRDVVKLSPNVFFQSTGGNGTGRFMPNLTFRGLQPPIPLPRSQPGAVFVDGNYVLGGVNAVNTSDVERVEVLRGPQNTYFGRNTFAGAINFITRNPGDSFGADVELQTSDRSTNALRASVEGPLVGDWLSGRLSVNYRDKQGHYVARDGGRMGDEQTQSVTGTLYARPSERSWIRLRASYQQDDDGPGQLINLTPSSVGDTCGARFIDKGLNLAGTKQGFNVSLPYFCGKIPGIDQLGESIVSTNTTLNSPLLTSLGRPTALTDAFLSNSIGMEIWDKVPKPNGVGMRRDIFMANLQANHEFENGISIGLNFGYDDTRTGLILDADRTFLENVFQFVPQVSTTESYELRVRSGQEQRLRWLVGATYYKGDFVSNFGNGGSGAWESRTLPTQPFNSVVRVQQSLSRNPYAANELAEVRAVYGELEFDILDNLTVTAEVRRQEDSSIGGKQFLPTFPTLPTELTFKDTLPRVIVQWQPTEDWNLYASYSKGVLPGQENTGYTQRTPFQQQLIQQQVPNVQSILGSDELDNYEIGSKQTLLDGRLRYALSIYKMEWKNIKGSTPLVLPRTSETNPAPLTLPGVTISGSAEFQGLEFEGGALITSNWDVAVGIGYQEGEFTDWFEAGLLRELAGGQSPGSIPGNPNFGAVQWKGNALQRQPKWTGNLNSTYRGALGDSGWDWSVRGEVNYTGKAWDSTANIVQTDDFYRVNARIGFEKDNLGVELFVTNLFNDNTWDFAYRTTTVNPLNSTSTILPLGNAGVFMGFALLAPEKREVGLRLKYKF